MNPLFRDVRQTRCLHDIVFVLLLSDCQWAQCDSLISHNIFYNWTVFSLLTLSLGCLSCLQTFSAVDHLRLIFSIDSSASGFHYQTFTDGTDVTADKLRQ